MTDTTTTPEGGSTTTPASPAATFTQADVDRIIADRLKREREQTAARFADYDALKAKAAEADSSKTELQKLAERVEASEKRAADAEAKQLRAEIASAKGLTAAQAKRLSGSTKEELEADAAELLAAFGGKKDAEPEPDAGQAVFGRPKERLTPGAAPDAEPEKSTQQLVDEVWKKARGE